MQLQPPARLLKFLDRDVVLADRLVLPLESGRVDLAPERKVDLELQVVFLLLAECLNEYVCLIHSNGLVLESGAARHIVAVGVLHLYEERLKVLGPLERRAHEDRLVLRCMESGHCRVKVGPD